MAKNFYVRPLMGHLDNSVRTILGVLYTTNRAANIYEPNITFRHTAKCPAIRYSVFNQLVVRYIE